MLRIKRKQDVQEKGIAPVFIGISGLQSGCGVTHLTLSAAVYASQSQGLRTAYVELTGDHQIQNLLAGYEQKMFRYHGISMYANAACETLEKIIANEYDIILLDFGSRGKEIPKEFRFLSKKILVADGAAWKQKQLTDWLRAKKRSERSQYQYLITSGDLRYVKELKRSYGISIFCVPFQTDPFELRPSMIRLLEKLL